MNKNIKIFKDALSVQFPTIKFAALETIDGKKVPCYYDGVSLISLAPSDTQCEIVYFRHLNSDSITNVDLGGCSKVPIINYNLRLVFYSKPRINNQLIISQKIYKSLQGHDINMKVIEEDQSKVLNSETSISKNIVLKNCNYLSIDFTISKVMDFCDTDDC